MTERDILYRSFLREISHSLRSPLSVAMGVVNDHLQGYFCAKEDFEAAGDSLAKIKSFLDLIKCLSFLNNEKQKINLRNFLTSPEFAGIFRVSGSLNSKISEGLEVRVDPLALSGILKTIILLLPDGETVLELMEGFRMEGGHPQAILQVYCNDRSDNPSFVACDESFKGMRLIVKQYCLENIIFDLLKQGCLLSDVECCQVPNFEKNTRFILTF